jgi:hypothetical protein
LIPKQGRLHFALRAKFAVDHEFFEESVINRPGCWVSSLTVLASSSLIAPPIENPPPYVLALVSVFSAVIASAFHDTSEGTGAQFTVLLPPTIFGEQFP